MVADDKTSPITASELAAVHALRRERDRAHLTLLITYRDGTRALTLVEGQRLTIGRSEPSDVALRDESLSRQHAIVEVKEGAVWVEDLQSTNGCFIDGEKIERAELPLAKELRLGAATAVLYRAGEGQPLLGLGSDDWFQAELELEFSRAKTLGRGLSLLMVRLPDQSAGGWFSPLRSSLRSFDRVALYSVDTVEILLPEADADQARALAKDLVAAAGSQACCGTASYPGHAASAAELVFGARAALREAGHRGPVQTAIAPGERAPESPADAAQSEASPSKMTQSEAMGRVYATIDRLASSAIPVLIEGETGVGKEVVARAIHERGKRKKGPLICINCGAIPSQLLESTLFGHEKGAFTGADQQQKGIFESASGGTVLLDEVGELPAAAQAALLRVLESKQIRRVGASKEIAVDVRVLAATHRDLEAMSQSGEFRLDLLYRLNAMTLTIPPLRQRKEEIPGLVSHFVEQANSADERKIEGVDAAALSALDGYAWPGNIRELRNAIERAVVIAQDTVVGLEDLPEKIRSGAVVLRESALAVGSEAPAEASAGGAGEINLKAELLRHESALILAALKEARGDRHLASSALGIPLRTLHHKMRLHGIKKLAYDRQDC